MAPQAPPAGVSTGARGTVCHLSSAVPDPECSGKMLAGKLQDEQRSGSARTWDCRATQNVLAVIDARQVTPGHTGPFSGSVRAKWLLDESTHSDL